MHHFDANFSKFSGGDPLPHFSATHLSEASGFIGHLCPPAVEVLNPPLFYEYNCRRILNFEIIDYGMFIFYNGSPLEIRQIFSSKQTNMTTKQDNY